MNFSEKKYKENCTKAKFAFKLKSFEAKWQKLSFIDDEIQLLLKIYIEYKAEREYCGVDWKSVRKKRTDGFPNSENAEQEQGRIQRFFGDTIS